MQAKLNHGWGLAAELYTIYQHEEVQALLPSMSPGWQDIGSSARNYHRQQQKANTTTECVECTLHNTMKACQSILGHSSQDMSQWNPK